MNTRKIIRLLSLFSLCVFLGACNPVSQTQTQGDFNKKALTPYFTATITPTITPTLPSAPTVTLVPTVTATPTIYVIKGSETLWTIAAKAGLTIAEIEAANPGINAYSLKVGMKIVVPAASGIGGTQEAATPTAIPVAVSAPKCTPSLTGGEYCFAVVDNQQSFTLQNLTAQFILTDNQSGATQVQPVLLPLNHLTAGSSLPLFAYFPPPVASSFNIQIQILSASPDTTTGSTYLALQVSSQTKITADGLSVEVTGTVKVASAASRFWIVAVGYDKQGNVVAVRQFDKTAALTAGTPSDFSVYLYSVSGDIDHVTVFGEAAP